MNFEEFSKLIDEKKRTNPIWFQLESDTPSSNEEICQLEASIDAQLPDEYKKFVTKFGSGHFAFGAIYSPNPDSDFPLEKTNFNNQGIKKNHIIFSENGSGDYYGFQVSEKKCSSRVFFWDHELEECHKTEYSNLFAFLASTALYNNG